MLSMLLTYFGGQRNRPRWIAWGVVFSAMSCFILAWPHFIYGAGDEALSYTKEYVSKNQVMKCCGGDGDLFLFEKFMIFVILIFLIIECIVDPSIETGRSEK